MSRRGRCRLRLGAYGNITECISAVRKSHKVCIGLKRNTPTLMHAGVRARMHAHACSLIIRQRLEMRALQALCLPDAPAAMIDNVLLTLLLNL